MNDFWRVFWAVLFWPYFAARTFFRALLDRPASDHVADHITDNEPIYFGQGTDTTSPFTDSTSAWGSGATGYYGGSTGYWPSTTAMPMTTMPPPTTPPPPPTPKPVIVPDLDAPRVIDLD